MNALMAAQATRDYQDRPSNRTSIANKYNKQIRESVLELFRTATHLSIECKEFLYKFIFCIVIRCLRRILCGKQKLIGRINCVKGAIIQVIEDYQRTKKDINDIVLDRDISVDIIKTQIRNNCSRNKKWFDEVILEVKELHDDDPDYNAFWLNLLPEGEPETLYAQDNVISIPTEDVDSMPIEDKTESIHVNAYPAPPTINVNGRVIPPSERAVDLDRGGKSKNRNKRTKKRNRRAVTKRKKN